MNLAMTHSELSALHSALDTCRIDFPELWFTLRVDLGGILITKKAHPESELGINLYPTSDWLNIIRRAVQAWLGAHRK